MGVGSDAGCAARFLGAAGVEKPLSAPLPAVVKMEGAASYTGVRDCAAG